jgi:hypothetical protein
VLRKNQERIGLSFGLVSLLACLIFMGSALGASGSRFNLLPAQERLPAPPADRTLIYFGDGQSALQPLGFETGTTPLRVETVAKGDKRSYVELRGESSPTLITNIEPRFYLFLPDDGNAKPPLIVRLTERRGARRVTAIAQKGYKGFAIDSEEIIKPHYRVLGREAGQVFMEIRPRDPLMLGEYAIIGADLKRIATFRIAAASNP